MKYEAFVDSMGSRGADLKDKLLCQALRLDCCLGEEKLRKQHCYQKNYCRKK